MEKIQKNTIETPEHAQNYGRLNNTLLNDKWVLEGSYRKKIKP